MRPLCDAVLVNGLHTSVKVRLQGFGFIVTHMHVPEAIHDISQKDCGDVFWIKQHSKKEQKLALLTLYCTRYHHTSWLWCSLLVYHGLWAHGKHGIHQPVGGRENYVKPRSKRSNKFMHVCVLYALNELRNHKKRNNYFHYYEVTPKNLSRASLVWVSLQKKQAARYKWAIPDVYSWNNH